MKGLEIRLLGEVQVVRDGRPLALPASKKTRALLAYLAATGRAHLREKLCELLWPGPDDPRAALRWSLTKIRALVDDKSAERVAADRERVAFDAKAARVDLVEVRARLAHGVTETETGALREVAAAYRGELLEGLDLPDAYRFQEWLIGEREAARATRLHVLGTLVDRLASDPETALRYARERVGIDPLSEAAHVAVVRLLAQLGKKREALAQVETCARILATELQTRPSAALLAARMAIGQTSAPPPAIADGAARANADPGPSSTPAPSSRAMTTRLLGRARESRAIDRALAAVFAGERPCPLLFSGEPGIGKSRLLDELTARAVARGARVLRGRAYEAERIRPYGAWVDALRSTSLGALDDVLRADLAPLLPELGQAAATGDRARLFDAVVRLLAGLAASAPVVVLIDDVQWLDEGSAALLHTASRAEGLEHVLLAAGARGEELADNAAALRLVRALAQGGRLERMDLAPLDESATAELARAQHPDVDVARVLEGSGGNPLFAIEVACALAAGNDGPVESLEALIGERLAGLDDAARDLVPWAAALGRTFDLDVLARVTGLAAATLASGVEELERRGIVRASPGAADYDFAHDLIRDGAYRRISAPRRRLVHAMIARALSAGGLGDGSTAGNVAHHAALGGERELAARAYVAAGERALRVFAHVDATRFAGAGIEQAAMLPPDVRIPLQLALVRVQVMSAGLKDERRTLATQISRIVLEAQDAGLHAEAAGGLTTLSILQHDAGDFEGAHASTLRAADVARGADPSQTAYQLADTARCLVMIEREMPRADAMLAEARAILGDGADATMHYSWGQGLMDRFRGAAGEARPRLERALALARTAEDRWAECEALMALAQLALEGGRIEDALAWCGQLGPVAAKMGEGSEGPAAEALEALVHASAGEANGARLDGAIARLREIDAKGMLAYVLNVAAALDLAHHRPVAAKARAAEALKAALVVERKAQIVIARALLGRAALAAGDRAGAARHLEDVRDDATAPLAVSAHARTAVFDLADALGVTLEGERPCLT